VTSGTRMVVTGSGGAVVRVGGGLFGVVVGAVGLLL